MLKVINYISNKAFGQLRTTVQNISSGKRIVIIFMTDGCDTCNRADAIVDAQNNLRLFLRNCGSDCIVHIIGYSNAHDLNMMNTLKTLDGTRVETHMRNTVRSTLECRLSKQ